MSSEKFEYDSEYYECIRENIKNSKKTMLFQNCNHLDLYQVYLPGEDYNFENAKNNAWYKLKKIMSTCRYSVLKVEIEMNVEHYFLLNL